MSTGEETPSPILLCSDKCCIHYSDPVCDLCGPRWKQSVNKWLHPGFRILLILLKINRFGRKGKLPGAMNEDGSTPATKTLQPHSECEVCIKTNTFLQTTARVSYYQQIKRTSPLEQWNTPGQEHQTHCRSLKTQLEKLRARPGLRTFWIGRMEKPWKHFQRMVQLESHFTDQETGAPWGLGSSVSSQKMWAFPSGLRL